MAFDKSTRLLKKKKRNINSEYFNKINLRKLATRRITTPTETRHEIITSKTIQHRRCLTLEKSVEKCSNYLCDRTHLDRCSPMVNGIFLEVLKMCYCRRFVYILLFHQFTALLNGGKCSYKKNCYATTFDSRISVEHRMNKRMKREKEEKRNFRCSLQPQI